MNTVKNTLSFYGFDSFDSDRSLQTFFYLNSKSYSKIVTKATHFPDLPLGGFFCNGEIGPVGNTNFYINIFPLWGFVV
jgi:hypothetical protein